MPPQHPWTEFPCIFCGCWGDQALEGIQTFGVSDWRACWKQNEKFCATGLGLKQSHASPHPAQLPHAGLAGVPPSQVLSELSHQQC